MANLIIRKDSERAKRYLKGAVPIVEDVVVESSPVSEKKSTILDVIYGLDPVTQLPSGDFACYLGNDVAPEVKSYIQANLLNEFPRGTAVPEEQQDLLFDYMRTPGEPIHEYVQRISDFERSRVKSLKDINK